MNFPGHNYLGPGNPVSNGPPVDADDAIAKEHDEAYEEAQNSKDTPDNKRRFEEAIFHADVIAIFKFLKEHKDNNNWHALIGGIGLSIKVGLEKLLGKTLYPWELKKSPKEVIKYHENRYINNRNYISPRNLKIYNQRVKPFLYENNNSLYNYYSGRKKQRIHTDKIHRAKKPQTYIHKIRNLTIKQKLYLNKQRYQKKDPNWYLNQFNKKPKVNNTINPIVLSHPDNINKLYKSNLKFKIIKHKASNQKSKKRKYVKQTSTY